MSTLILHRLPSHRVQVQLVSGDVVRNYAPASVVLAVYKDRPEVQQYIKEGFFTQQELKGVVRL
jgi:hypothetical protein